MFLPASDRPPSHQRTDATAETTDSSNLPSTPVAVLERSGDYWQVGLGAQHGLIRSASGLEYVAALISQARHDWHVLDLYSNVNSGSTMVQGGTGPVLDDQARRAYLDALRRTRRPSRPGHR